MEINFSDKIVLVAGGTGGLGNAVTRAFLEEGAKVAVTYRKEEEFTALKQAAGAKADALEGAVIDVTDERATSEFAGRILSRHGRVDVLVNTVGGFAGGVKLWELETKVFDAMLSLNLRSGYALARAVVPAMLAQETWSDCECCGEGRVRSWRRRFCLCGFKGRGGGDDGLARCRGERDWSESELGAAEHYRYVSEPPGYAECRLYCVAKAGGYREGNFVLVQR